MFNLFRMELYRAKHSKVTKITLIILALIGFFEVLTAKIQGENFVDICSTFTGSVTAKLMLIIWAIAVSVYISGEYKNGYLKSIAGQIPSRSNLALSKLFYCICYTICAFLIMFVTIAVSTFALCGSSAIFGFKTQMLVIWAIQLLLHIGFASVFIFTCVLTKNSALGIGIGFLMGTGLTSIVYEGIGWILSKIGFSYIVNFSNYMIDCNIELTSLGVKSDVLIRSSIVGIVFVLAFVALSTVIYNKKDIR